MLKFLSMLCNSSACSGVSWPVDLDSKMFAIIPKWNLFIPVISNFLDQESCGLENVPLLEHIDLFLPAVWHAIQVAHLAYRHYDSVRP